MPAPQPRYEALEIAVSDVPAPIEAEREATISLLPYSHEPPANAFAGATDAFAGTDATNEDEFLDESLFDADSFAPALDDPAEQDDLDDAFGSDEDEFAATDDDPDAWLDADEVMLEASDVIPVEAARAAVFEFTFDDDDERDDGTEVAANQRAGDTFVDIEIVEPEPDAPTWAMREPEAEPVLWAAAPAMWAPESVAWAPEPVAWEPEPVAWGPPPVAAELLDLEAEPAREHAPERTEQPEPEPAIALVDPIEVPLWRGANSFGYALSRGLRGMGQSPLVQLLAVGTMAVCMLLLGTTTLIFQNAQRVVQDLGVDTPVTVYMQPDVDRETIVALQARVAELPEVASVEHVPPELALERLQAGLGGNDSLGSVGERERADLLAGIDASTLPDSLEIALVPGVDPGFADALAERVDGMAGVEEVSALGPWVQDVERMLETLRWLAFGVAGLVSLACLAIVWNTIRLGVFARRSEIEILRLVGGTKRFVRGPFVVEGVLQGVLGTGLAIAGLWLGFELIRPFLERGMALMFASGSLRFFTMIELGVALGFGAALGLIGSRAAVARHA